MTDKEFEEFRKECLEPMEEMGFVKHFWKDGEETWKLTEAGMRFVAETLHKDKIEQEFKKPKAKV